MDMDKLAEQRNGPKVNFSCIGCKHYEQERFQVQGDVGYDKWCLHSGEKRPLGSPYRDTTPDWCPLLPAIAGPDEVVVPRKATDAMMRAGYAPLEQQFGSIEGCYAFVRQVYNAMLDAAEEK